MGIIVLSTLTRKVVSMRFFSNLLVTTACVCALLTPCAAKPQLATLPGLADGPGIWVNMWNYPTSDFDAYCQTLHAKGIRNLFIETSRSNTPSICHPDWLSPIIDACHRYKIRVIAWSFAELGNPASDADKLIEAARFASASGQHVDALAANLEKNLDQNKVEAYSKKIRSALGTTQTLVAVVYSPLNQAPPVAHIPWKTLAEYYDVIAPMNYWNSKYKKLDPYSYTLSTIQRVRELTGRSDIEIHMIGDGMGTHAESIGEFLKACHDGEATSASLYPNFKVTAEQLDTISQYANYFPVNARFRLAAFREALHQGVLRDPQNHNPAAAITRGQYYELLARLIYGDNSDTDIQAQTLKLFSECGGNSLSSMPIEEALAQPLSAKEALNVVAKLVDKTGVLPKQSTKPASAPGKMARIVGGKHARVDRWFVQPAYAAEGGDARSRAGVKPINYMEAAQIVLSAASGLK